MKYMSRLDSFLFKIMKYVFIATVFRGIRMLTISSSIKR